MMSLSRQSGRSVGVEVGEGVTVTVGEGEGVTVTVGVGSGVTVTVGVGRGARCGVCVSVRVTMREEIFGFAVGMGVVFALSLIQSQPEREQRFAKT
jgi:hypothetical protein